MDLEFEFRVKNACEYASFESSCPSGKGAEVVFMAGSSRPLSERSLSKCSLQILTEAVGQGAVHLPAPLCMCVHKLFATRKFVPYVMPEPTQHPGSIHQPQYTTKTECSILHPRFPNAVIGLVFIYCTQKSNTTQSVPEAKLNLLDNSSCSEENHEVLQ